MEKTTTTLERPAENHLEQTLLQKKTVKLELPPVKTLSSGRKSAVPRIENPPGKMGLYGGNGMPPDNGLPAVRQDESADETSAPMGVLSRPKDGEYLLALRKALRRSLHAAMAPAVNTRHKPHDPGRPAYLCTAEDLPAMRRVLGRIPHPTQMGPKLYG